MHAGTGVRVTALQGTSNVAVIPTGPNEPDALCEKLE